VYEITKYRHNDADFFLLEKNTNLLSTGETAWFFSLQHTEELLGSTAMTLGSFENAAT